MALVLILVASGGAWLFKKYAWAQDHLKDVTPRYAMMTGLMQEKEKLAAIQNELGTNYAHYVHPASTEAGQAGNEALQRVRDLASANKLDVVSSQVLPAREENGLERIGLNLRVEGPYDGVTKFLQDLARVQPVIYNDSMQLTAQNQRFVPRAPSRGMAAPQPAEASAVLGATAQLSLFVLRAKP
jgi:general secretion pathway protein M